MRLSKIVLILMFLSACGPMNKEKPAASGGNDQVTPQALKGVNATTNNLFLVYTAPQKKDAPAEVGDNIYNLRVLHANDLSGVTDKSKLTVSYWMPEMPAMGKADAEATRQEDGTYNVTLFFSMAGKWQMTLTIQDESKKDDYVFETKL